jgi:hypothetical protein
VSKVQYSITILVTAPEGMGNPFFMDKELMLEWMAKNETEVMNIEES